MWQVKLITGIVNGLKAAGRGKKVVRKTPIIARSIINKGNGQLRTVVKGFGNGNLTADDVLKYAKNNSSIFGSFRKVVAGFTGKTGELQRVLPSMMSRVKFFPGFRIPKLTRHYVANANSARNVVNGFSTSTNKALKVNKALPNRKPVQMFQQERVVIQGFGGDSTKPVYKKTELKPTTQRTVVKGFSV